MCIPPTVLLKLSMLRGTEMEGSTQSLLVNEVRGVVKLFYFVFDFFLPTCLADGRILSGPFLMWSKFIIF